MTRVVIVGGGLGGCASAARLAKLGHQVTLVEALPRLGGAVGTESRDGYTWDSGPASTALPAVLRDLFRKSGRPLERELDLVPVQPLREHRFPDGSGLVLPSGSRAAQLHAVEEAFGRPAGREWVDYVHAHARAWDLLRRDALERAYSPQVAAAETRALLGSRQPLARAVRRGLSDPRLRAVATYHARAAGHDPRRAPAWFGILDYVEQNFGTWTVPGGFGVLTDLLGKRLAERRVQVLLSTRVVDIEMGPGGPLTVRTDAGPVPAETVVVAIDPRQLPVLAAFGSRRRPVAPPQVTHLGLRSDPATGWAAGEVVVHRGEGLLTVRTTGGAPDGGAAWTLLAQPRRGSRSLDDPVAALARAGVDVRDLVHTRVDRSPGELVEHYSGSPYGVVWRPRRSAGQLGPTTPLPGVYAAGAVTAPAGWLPFVGLSATVVAERLGQAVTRGA